MKASQIADILKKANDPKNLGAAYLLEVMLLSGAKVTLTPTGVIFGCLYEENEGRSLFIPCERIEFVNVLWT